MGKSSPSTILHIMSLTTLPTSITYYLLFALAHILILSLTWPPEFSRTHPCWGHTLENHLLYTLQHKCVSYLLMELTLETPFLPLRPLHTSMFHQLKKYYLKNSLRTLLHHLSPIPPRRGKSWFGRQSLKKLLKFPSSNPHLEFNNFK
jgi:hypothetical protein